MSNHLVYTPIDSIPEIRDTLRATFASGVTRPIAWRKHQLSQLVRFAQTETEAIYEAIVHDSGKPRFEVVAMEIGGIIKRALESAQELDEWVKPECPVVPDMQKSWKPIIYKMPKGTVLIISPWNAPFILTFQPLIGAICAGCCALIKPSECVPRFSQLIAERLPQYLDSSAYRIVNGAVPETTRLLELQWDHIFYTGNGRVGHIVASAAAKHLTPCSLELGGKSPVFVDGTFDVKLAAKRILWGKCNISGQICVAPDYIVVLREKQAELVRGFEEAYKAFFPDGALHDANYGSIINDLHFKRLNSVLDRSKGRKIVGVMEARQDPDKRRFEPVVVENVQADDSLLEEEIFGPILPIVAVDSLSEAIDLINARPHPLVVYAFTENSDTKERFINETRSGGIVFNDTFGHLGVMQLPFSGFGESGYGYQFMRYSFDAFTHLRSSVDIPAAVEPFLNLRYPPYTPEAFRARQEANISPA